MLRLWDMKPGKTNKQGIGLSRPDSPYSPEECEVIIQKLELFLDGQLSGKSREEVERLIQDCNYCAEQYEFEKRMRDILRRSWKSVSQEALGLVENIRQRLRGRSAD
jgi:anti-sigma factor (TIGR02949 family)